MLKMSIFLRSLLSVLFFLGRHAGDIIKVSLSFISTTLDQSISTTWKLMEKGKRQRRTRAECPNGRSLSWFL